MRFDILKLFSSETDSTASTDIRKNGAITQKDSTVQEPKTSTDARPPTLFRPRHAARDALLSVPITTREYLHITHRQQEVWNEIGFSPAQTTRSSYPQKCSVAQAGSSSQPYHSAQLERRNMTKRAYQSAHSPKLMQLNSISDRQNIMMPGEDNCGYKGKGKERAADNVSDQVRNSKRQDSAVADPPRKQLTERPQLSSVNESAVNNELMDFTADDHALWSYLNDEDQICQDKTQDSHELKVSSPVEESHSPLTMPQIQPCDDTGTLTMTRKPCVKSKSDTEVPQLRPRRYFSHAEEKSYMSPHQRRTTSHTTDGSHRSSTVSQLTINNDAYDSSVNLSGTASTAPTIAESDGGSQCKTNKD